MEAENNKDQKQAASPFPKMEEAVLQFWQDNQIFAKSVKKKRHKEVIFLMMVRLL